MCHLIILMPLGLILMWLNFASQKRITHIACECMYTFTIYVVACACLFICLFISCILCAYEFRFQGSSVSGDREPNITILRKKGMAVSSTSSFIFPVLIHPHHLSLSLFLPLLLLFLFPFNSHSMQMLREHRLISLCFHITY